MSYFVTITFDLNHAKSSVYPRIHRSLDQIDFGKYIQGRKANETQLPSNTFVAEFESDDFDNSTELREWLKYQMKSIFKLNNVSGKFFIAVGKRWAWSVGKV
ncbi:putative uncharacterized phage protein [Moritella viscosa]|nr:hypothetical protein [Moritella viscosa]CED59835.1 putative uncharacterized phage protein [Moritella viscosa]SHO03509.1 Putative uncharacterized protein [Moritella viscosa]